ncbi:WD repeat-containing protein 3 [Elysia marginata]|uniref:WD repeat-containing protein 3 n=1 Tax=Elysia marginata TaxID=1093978 RepID=A0AAV4EB04_9GAST|nr:WD repeat-containing protein 3 [Elysia marginata]
MGVTKQYLRVAPGPVFGVVASHKANIITFPASKYHSARCAVAACENVIIWDLATKQKLLTLEGEKWEVTSLAESPSTHHLAVGYGNGSIKIFQIDTGQSDITFQGHKSAVTCLAYDQPGLRLVSGAKDTDVILWDIVSEAGLFRLKGHKKEITQAAFLKCRDVVITSSKDAYIKFWDVSTQHCFYTVVGHRSEVYGFLLLRNETRLISGSADSELRVWDIQYLDDEESKDKDEEGPPQKKMKIVTEEGDMDVDESSGSGSGDEEEKAFDESMQILTCKKIGSVMRQGRERLVTLCTDPQEKMLLCHGPDKHLEVFQLPSLEDLNKLKAKRVKKLRKKHLDTGEEVDTTSVQLKLEDEIKFLERFKFSAKLWSVHCCLEASKEMRFCAILSDNKIEHGTLVLDKNKVEMGPVVPLSQLGHRSVVRTLSFSADNATILSASSEEVKLWNRDSLQCIRTMACDYALCSMIVSGDRHAIIGTKTGKLQLFDLNQGSCLESFDAHEGALWSVAPMPDQRGLVSGGADHDLKFWNYELVSDTNPGAKHKVLTLEHTRTLKMDEDILCIKFTPNHKLLAVALLDSTVKVFFADTLKFFLSLYGHKLPVTCMDISTDSTLIVTGSADRNIKIWGLDFGDCHKSIFAHDESVTCLQFIPKTHMFVSGGKDKKVKHWDADNFENIQTLEGHQGEVRSLAISPTGGTVVTSSQDRSLRLWERTEEPLVLEEEREMEREKEEEEAISQEGEEVVPGETSEEVKMAGKKTIDTVKGTERIMEALEIYETYVEEQKQAKLAKVPPPPPHPMMTAYQTDGAEEFVVETIRRIRASELNGSLLSLPFSYVTKLLPILDFGLIHKRETELVCKCLNFLLRIHHGEITSNHGNMPIIERLKQHSVSAVKHHRDLTAFNAAGLSFLSKHLEESNGIMMFADATVKRKKKKRAVLVLK